MFARVCMSNVKVCVTVCELCVWLGQCVSVCVFCTSESLCFRQDVVGGRVEVEKISSNPPVKLGRIEG